MSAQPRLPVPHFHPSSVPYDPGQEIRELIAKCPVNRVQTAGKLLHFRVPWSPVSTRRAEVMIDSG